MQSCDFKMTRCIRHSHVSRISHGAEWVMTGTPWSYAAFRGAGCARDQMPGHNGQTNPRLISTVQIIEPISPSAISRGTQAKPGPPGRCIFNRSPRLGARGPNDATTISETNPLMINKSICQPLDPRASRGQLVRWIFMSLLPVRATLPWRRWKRRRPRWNGREEAYCDSIDLSYYSTLLIDNALYSQPDKSDVAILSCSFAFVSRVFKVMHSLFSMKSLLC